MNLPKNTLKITTPKITIITTNEVDNIPNLTPKIMNKAFEIPIAPKAELPLQPISDALTNINIENANIKISQIVVPPRFVKSIKVFTPLETELSVASIVKVAVVIINAASSSAVTTPIVKSLVQSLNSTPLGATENVFVTLSISNGFSTISTAVMVKVPAPIVLFAENEKGTVVPLETLADVWLCSLESPSYNVAET